MTPQVGDIVRCEHGSLGLIIHDLQPIIYEDGTKVIAWTGIHLEAQRTVSGGYGPGDDWISVYPTVVKRIDTMMGELLAHHARQAKQSRLGCQMLRQAYPDPNGFFEHSMLVDSYNSLAIFHEEAFKYLLITAL